MGNCWGSEEIPIAPITKTTPVAKSPRAPTSAPRNGGRGARVSPPIVGKIIKPNLRVYTYQELKSATKNFKPDSVLGEGGFGRVYKGWIDESTLAPSKAGVGVPVAVKRCNADSAQGVKEWKDYNAKLSDFGLARLGPVDRSHVTTQAVGTYGYAAPEYINTGHLYVNSDVYGFGVVLLEIITGLRAYDINRSSGQTSLVDWYKPMLNDKAKLKKIVDPRMQDYPPEGMNKLSQLIVKCLQNDPKCRPGMSEVLLILERISTIRMNPTKGSKASSSQSYPNRPHSYHPSPNRQQRGDGISGMSPRRHTRG